MKTVAVYLGSSDGFSPVFSDNAAKVGRMLAENGIGIVYGGASVGTMWAMASAALESGGQVTGVFPENFRGRKEYRDRNIEIKASGLTQMICVKNLEDRIKVMTELSEACIILPGSFGTMHELFSHIVGLQLGLHAKPVFILDLDGYYSPLRQLAENMVDNGFMPERHRALLRFCSSVEELEAELSK